MYYPHSTVRLWRREKKRHARGRAVVTSLLPGTGSGEEDMRIRRWSIGALALVGLMAGSTAHAAPSATIGPDLTLMFTIEWAKEPQAEAACTEAAGDAETAVAELLDTTGLSPIDGVSDEDWQAAALAGFVLYCDEGAQPGAAIYATRGLTSLALEALNTKELRTLCQAHRKGPSAVQAALAKELDLGAGYPKAQVKKGIGLALKRACA